MSCSSLVSFIDRLPLSLLPSLGAMLLHSMQHDTRMYAMSSQINIQSHPGMGTNV